MTREMRKRLNFAEAYGGSFRAVFRPNPLAKCGTCHIWAGNCSKCAGTGLEAVPFCEVLR